MELVKPDVKYKDSFVEALKDGFYLGSQSPMSDDAIADIEKDFEAFLMHHFLILQNRINLYGLINLNKMVAEMQLLMITTNH